MKKILSLLIIAVLFACSASREASKERAENNSNTTNKTNNLPEEVIITSRPILQMVSSEAIESSMNYLASDELEGRATGSEGIEKAAVFIENYLKDAGIKPYFETYRDTFNLKDIVGYNIVGVVEGNDPALRDEFIILGGHYDHIGFGKEVNGDKIANGANDDASGTIAAMEFAKHFANTKTNKRSILVTLYAAEEMGLRGSSHLAKRLKENDFNAYTMINFEMIGVPRANEHALAYMSGYERSNFAENLNKYAGEEIIGFFPKAKEFNLFKRSDNYPFYNELNIPAHAISTFDFTNYDYYHHVDDEADKMDYDHMARFLNKMIPALEGMMNAPTKEVTLKK